MAGKEQDTVGAGPPPLADFIRTHRGDILARWAEMVRTKSPAQELSRERIVDHMPQLLGCVADLMECFKGTFLGTPTDAPEIHALTRLDEGFEITDLASEYGQLRFLVLEIYEERIGPNISLQELRRFNAALDEAILLSVRSFAHARERTLRALDRLSEAGLASGNVEDLLPRLLRVLLETTEAVDAVSVLIRDNDHLRVRASAGLEEEVEAGFRVRIGEGFLGQIAAERSPQETRDATNDARVTSPFIRQKKIRAMFGVPMVFGDELIGVAHMSSRSAYEFATMDKLLFRSMVQRAAELLVRAQYMERERALRENAERLQAQDDALLGSAPIGIAFLDTDLRYLRINEALARDNGYPVEDHLGRTVQEVLGDDARPLVPLLRRVIETGEPIHNAEVDFPNRGKRILANYFPVHARDGRLLGVGGAIVDITERALLIQELTRHRRLFTAVLDQVPIGVVVAEAPSGRMVLGNGAFARIWRRPFVPANNIEEYGSFPGLHPDGTRYAAEEWPLARAVRGETVSGEEILLVRGDGTQTVSLQAAGPVRDEDGEVMAAVVVVLDIADRKRAEEDLHRAAQFRETFLGIVSHDLRNPLNAITASASFLLNDESLSESHTRSIRRISKAAQRMARMIRDLLDFTRGRLGGGLPIEYQQADLRELCRSVVDELEVNHPSRHIELRTAGDLRGRFDPDRLTQLMGNLGKNAIDYSPEGTLVRIEATDDGERLLLCVHNEGSAIPPERLPRLFDAFSASDRGRESAGLGLGLYIARQIVEAHCGTIEVISTAEEGTTFIVHLPRDGCDAGKPGQ